MPRPRSLGPTKKRGRPDGPFGHRIAFGLFESRSTGGYSSSPSSSPVFEGASPPSIIGTSLGGSAGGAPALRARAGAVRFFAAFRGARLALALAFPAGFLALPRLAAFFLPRLLVFLVARFPTLP